MSPALLCNRFLTWTRLVRVFVWRDLREQYAGTLFGGLWSLFLPLLQVAVYWWVFGFIWALKVPIFGERGGELPFIVFLLAGLLPWLAFQDAINKAAPAILSRGDVLRHGAFPVGVFPVSRCLAAHLVFAGLLACFVLFVRPAVVLAEPLIVPAVIVLFVVQIVFACGLGVLLAALSVYIRDLPHVLSMILLGVFFTAPILYPLSQVPEAMREWLWLNPFAPFVLGYHALMLEGVLPETRVWLQAGVQAMLACGLGLFVFRRLRPGFADVV